jgi:hypothetical protein
MYTCNIYILNSILLCFFALVRVRVGFLQCTIASVAPRKIEKYRNNQLL